MRMPFRPTVFALAMVATWPVLAQQQAAAPKPDEEATQKIVITANKRAERQRDVSGTVSVLGGADLERRGARDQEDTLKLTPGVQFNKGDIASNTITIRGIGTSTTNEGSGAQQGPTGSYLEDVPLAAYGGKGTVSDPLTWDLDRVEVLRGPQGVLFGSGSLGGALRYLFNKPRFGEMEASVKLEGSKVSGGGSKASVFGMLNVPLSGKEVALRVVVFDRNDPGYVDNLGTGKKDANTVSQTGGRVLFGWKPTAAVNATLVASTQKTKQGDTFSVSPNADRLEHRSPNDSRRSVTSDFYSLTVDWNLGGMTLTSITGHWKNKSTTLIDDTELFASVGFVVPSVIRPGTGTGEATSQELRLASNPGGNFSWVAGAFHQQQKNASSAKQIDASAAFGISDLVDLTASGKGTESALFADTEFKLGGGWSAGAGGRYYRTSTESMQRGTEFGAPSNLDVPRTTDSGFTPRLSLKYRFGENTWYALASQGYRYGGRNGSAPFNAFKSDKLWNYETGLRLQPSAGLDVDLTAFVQDWTDAQLTFFSIGPGGLPRSEIGNVGKARNTGVEAALRYRINPVFDMAASLAYIDARTRVPVDIPAGRGSITALEGSRLPGTPRLQGALQGNARFAGPFESQGRANVTYTHVGDRVMFLGGNKPADAYDTVDIGLNFARGSWTIATGVANVTDERGVLSITGAPGGVGAFSQFFLQKPRTFTVSLRFDY